MGSEAKLWQNCEVPKLPLLAIAAMQSPDRSGMLTPPIHSSASVPFRWEEEPGKPRFSFTIPNSSDAKDTATQRKCLELPPRLLFMESKIPKLPPPINGHRGMFQPHQPPLRTQCCGSFRFDKKQLGAMVLRKKGVLIEKEWFCWLGKGGLGRKREVGSGCGSIFPSSLDKESESDSETEGGVVAESSNSRMMVAETQREGKFSSCLVQAKTEFWGSIGEGLKQINIPWKSKKHKKEHW